MRLLYMFLKFVRARWLVFLYISGLYALYSVVAGGCLRLVVIEYSNVLLGGL